MTIEEILSPERTLADQSDCSIKRVLEHLSELICQNQINLTSSEIFESFISRERLGSTGIGEGVVIPHITCNKINKPIGALVSLKNSIKYNSPDLKPVDIIFGLIVPKKSSQIQSRFYLELLGKITEKFSKKEYQSLLRKAQHSIELYRIAIQ